MLGLGVFKFFAAPRDVPLSVGFSVSGTSIGTIERDFSVNISISNQPHNNTTALAISQV